MANPIVVGTDGSETAGRAVEAAADLARALDAPLHVVAAYRHGQKKRARDQQRDAPADVEWKITPHEDADKILDRATGSLSDDGLKVETHAVEGDPADVIITVAEQQKAHLIVVGNKGMKGASRFVLGSVPDKISHHAPCNVLIVRTS